MLTRVLMTAALLSTLLSAQEPETREARMVANRRAKLAEAVFQKNRWLTDISAAREEAAASGKTIFAYFTRSYSP